MVIVGTPWDLAVWAGRQVPGGLLRALAAVPEPWLREAMASPVRQPLLDGVFAAAPAVLDGTPLHTLVTAVECRITGRPDAPPDVYCLRHDGARWCSGRWTGAPELTVTVDGVELLALATRRSNPVQAYLNGRLRLTGSPLIIGRLLTLLGARLSGG